VAVHVLRVENKRKERGGNKKTKEEDSFDTKEESLRKGRKRVCLFFVSPPSLNGKVGKRGEKRSP